MDANTIPMPAMLTHRQLAAMLCVSERTLYRRRAAGEVPRPVRIGGVVRWPLDVIESWISRGCPPIAESGVIAS